MSLDPKLERLIEQDIREVCSRRKTAQRAQSAETGEEAGNLPVGARRELTPVLVDVLVQRLIMAASYAELGPVPNRVSGRGAPPDNARIILAHDISHALTDLGLSDGLHFEADYQSLAVELYAVVASRIWPHLRGNAPNPRSTFRRMRCAEIGRN